MSRSFTVEHAKSGSKTLSGGRYMGSNPASAARKAATHFCREHKMSKKACTVNIVMRETTAGCSNKTFEYKAKRIYDPVTVERDGVEVEYEYRTEVKAAKSHKSPKKCKKSPKKSPKKCKKSPKKLQKKC
jgi:hypothetical protein